MTKGFSRCYNDYITKEKSSSDHRAISLISNNGKFVASILSRRLESKSEEVIKDQFGFWKGKDTGDAIRLMRIITEKVLDIKEEMCLCFRDWLNTFDHVNCTKLLEMFRNIGVNWR